MESMEPQYWTDTTHTVICFQVPQTTDVTKLSIQLRIKIKLYLIDLDYHQDNMFPPTSIL